MSGELGTCVRALVLALVVAGAILVLGPRVGFEVHPVPIIVGCLGLAGAVSYLYVAGETADAVEWPAPPLAAEMPQHPSEVRARKLSREVKGTLDRTPVAQRDLGRTLADLVAHRMVAHHGADPDRPLAAAGSLLSEGFVTYLEHALDPERTAPRLDRATLHAYLKEIDGL